MKLSAWIGLIAIGGCLGLVACSDDGDDGTGTDGGSGTGGSAGAATGGSAGASTGGTAGAGTGGSSGAGTGGSAGGNSCADCLETNCKTEDDACTANPDCVAINDCVADNCFAPDAGDQQACITTCSTGHEAGATAFGALITCGLTNCAADCQ